MGKTTAAIESSSGCFPSTRLSRILLYQHVIGAVLATRETDPIRQKILLRMLTELTLWVHQQRGRTFTTEDLITFFMEEQRRSWGETNDLIHAVIDSGIVEIVARETYGFRHQTFQEYLAASELARRLVEAPIPLREQAEAFIWGKRTYSRWTEVLRMMIGILIQNYGASGLLKASQWIEKLAQQHTSEEEDPGFLCFSLALVAVSELGEIPEWHSPQTVKLEISLLETWFDELILAAQRGQQRSRIRRLTSLLSEIVHFQESSIDSIFEKIVTTLKNKSRSVREMCIEVLGKFGSRSISILLQLLHDEMFDSDYELLKVLKELSEYVPLEPLLDSLHHEATSVHSRAIKAIGNLGDRAPLEPLLVALHDEHVSVREGAITALGNLGDRVPLEPLLAALHDTASSIRSAGAEALGNLRDHAPLEPLLAALYDDDDSVRQATVIALGNLGNRTPLEPLLAALYDSSWFVRWAAMRALGNLGERVPLDPLLDALYNTDLWTRLPTITALGNLGERAPLDPLLNILYDGFWSMRSKAVEALGNLGERVPLGPLFDILQDGSSLIRKDAIRIIQKREPEALLPLFQEALALLQGDAPGPIFRSIAFSFFADTLENIGSVSPDILEQLMELLQWPNWHVRVNAASALGKIRRNMPDKTIRRLPVLRQDTNPHNQAVRKAADEALAEILSLETGIEDD